MPVNFNQKGTKGNILLIGDSHAGATSFELNKFLTKENYNLTYLNTVLFTPNLNLFNRKTYARSEDFKNQNQKIVNYINIEKNLIVVFHQRWSQILLSTYFDNEEATNEYLREKGKDGRLIMKDSCCIAESERIHLVQQQIISSINLILEKGHKVILVYPVPEMSFNVPKELFKQTNKIFKTNLNKENFPIITTSYEVYKKRNKLIFETLDSVESSNIYRVYPHVHFCDKQIKNRCIGNDKKNIFYYDAEHMSLKGSTFIVSDIVNIIKKINK
jgi:hypothetical protein